jgi:iron complex transport system ATP-binding protein
MGLMFRVEHAEFYYDRARTSGFHDTSFSIQAGQVLSILGPNGCGKTTLLKCLSGIFRLSKGSIRLKGREISRGDRGEIARAIGYVPQAHQPAFPFTVLDVVLVGRAPHLGFLESPKPRDIAIAEESLESLGISHLKHKPYTQISGGEKQLVIFARVMAQQPSLLLLDEPTSHLDFGNQARVLGLVEKLAATGLPIIMTSHFPDHAFLVSNRVAIMKRGGIIAFGDPEEVMTDGNLSEIYGIDVKVVGVDCGFIRRICLPMTNGRDLFAKRGLAPGGKKEWTMNSRPSALG